MNEGQRDISGLPAEEQAKILAEAGILSYGKEPDTVELLRHIGAAQIPISITFSHAGGSWSIGADEIPLIVRLTPEGEKVFDAFLAAQPPTAE